MNSLMLNTDGVQIPQLGYGVWQVPAEEAEQAVTTALKAGYRHIDTASAYGNEEGVGRAVRDSGLPREKVFVTTKLWNGDHGRAEAAFDESLARLGLDHIDLFLIHWPVPQQDKYVQAWKAMEKIYRDGRARAIGVSNFTVRTLTRLMDETGITPAINQIELHPYLQQREMRAFHEANGILTEAWSPLGQGRGLLSDPALSVLSGKYGKTPAQIVLRWHLQLGNVVIPKSVTPARIAENIDVFDFILDTEDLSAIGALNKGQRLGPDPDTFNMT
ncbi:aldo/keto reductase [Nonomuraea gerenzanensis]|uniref:Oxidoreductase of aldo/keto reductase family, subgroup 1 n=2 Tax=Nonomuraea gerenzanensis TaxID=93944 RepID=A0A1M4E831_9ACTN|nr:aldo/keto reductase [Nonomuraea gerenzanensis]UBU17287.1 aldo/keto reductase [Nonomuraea gerenzanensis]SBO95031.1 oxidoreductase of aldo/keto reductase family, subgroup 1 [Nonomuraea gerenzanensis]